MPRYRTFPTAQSESDFNWFEPSAQVNLAQPQVYPSEPEFTGMYDADGHKIYRLADRVGFLSDEKR